MHVLLGRIIGIESSKNHAHLGAFLKQLPKGNQVWSRAEHLTGGESQIKNVFLAISNVGIGWVKAYYYHIGVLACGPRCLPMAILTSTSSISDFLIIIYCIYIYIYIHIYVLYTIYTVFEHSSTSKDI